jgi:hypothetical protein
VEICMLRLRLRGAAQRFVAAKEPRGGAVQLPAHMRRIVNSADRSYFYFEKFRRTSAAWPRVRFPKFEPLTEKFAKRTAQLQRLVAEKSDSGDTWRWFFIDAVHVRRNLPAPADRSAFWAAVDRAEETGKMWHALVASFKAQKNSLTMSRRAFLLP